MVIVLTAFASAVVTAVARGPVDGWPKLSSDDGRFTVRMPGPVDESSDVVETDATNLVRHNFACAAGQLLWEVSYVDLPDKLTIFRTPEQVLQLAFSGSRTMDRVKVFAETSGKLGTASFKRYRVEIPDGPVVSNLVVVDKSRVYHLLVVCPPGKFRHVGSKEFFDSFVITPPAGKRGLLGNGG